jgi:hypothetical protein
MSLEIAANDPTKDQAMAALAAANQAAGYTSNPEPKKDSASEPAPAPLEKQSDETPPPEPKPGDSSPEGSKSGTPATTETTKEPETKPADGKAKSEYSKNEERKARTWKEINAEKEAIRAEAAKVKQEREAWERERLADAKKREDAAKANVKPPEFYEDGATKLEAAAKVAEDNADFDRAAELRVRAKDARLMAKDLRERKPDPTAEQTKAAFETEQKKWVGKAMQDFGDLKNVKDAKGNEVNSPAMAKLKALITPGSDSYDQVVHEAVNTSPAGWYYAARLAHSETVAARVPTLEKDLAESRAEVKKQNEKLSVNGGGLVNTQPKPPDAQNEDLGQLGARLREAARMQKLPR